MIASLTTETAKAAQAAAHQAFTTTSGSLKPSAKVVRAALKAAGLEHLIQGRIGTGTSACTISLEGDLAERTLAVKVLRILWADSAERIWTMDYQGLPMTTVRISVDGWTRVVMATVAEEPSAEEMARRIELGRQAVELFRAQSAHLRAGTPSDERARFTRVDLTDEALEQLTDAELEDVAEEATYRQDAKLAARVALHQRHRIERTELARRQVAELVDEGYSTAELTRRAEQAEDEGRTELAAALDEAVREMARQDEAYAEAQQDAQRMEDEASRIRQDQADEESARLELQEALGRTEPIEPETTVTLVDRQEWRSTWNHMDLGGARRMVRRDTLQPGDKAWSSHYGLATVGYVLTGGLTTEVCWIGQPSQGLARSERYEASSTVPLFSTATEVDRHNARQWLQDIHAGVLAVACRECHAEPGQECLRMEMAPESVTRAKLGGHFQRYWDAERGSRA